ncbi:FixH family protein [Candidatus Ruthia endofausta]|uniref:FixH family protein n=1 Tax=Candidatus Ruthia endofausta TaxID=2738852 RepID=A0A6N0HQT4_9GAMM|nr:FixH family protein [Candidatus Ruthia endofausta]QKQ24667.1 FixH family protein [Candidatus Ruthia endofausta]
MSIHKSPIMMAMLVLFITLVGATVYRIITALETHPGLVVEDAYLSGKRYAEILNHKNQLAQFGWTLNLVTPKVVVHNIKQTYTANSAQRGKTLTDALVIVYFYRPLEKAYDFSINMAFHQEINQYQAQVILPLKGRWDVVVEVVKGGVVQRTSRKLFAQ